MTKKSLIYGIGINDAEYATQPRIKGKNVPCRYYVRWFGMLERCYSEAHRKIYPSYIGCTIVEEWKLFSNFKAWMEKQDWEGKELDKDILVRGNKVYGPDTCCFVYKKTNLLLRIPAKATKYLLGVQPKSGKFRAKININGCKTHLGTYDTQQLAYKAYCIAKAGELRRQATDLEYPKNIQEGLLRWAEYYENGKV